MDHATHGTLHLTACVKCEECLVSNGHDHLLETQVITECAELVYITKYIHNIIPLSSNVYQVNITIIINLLLPHMIIIFTIIMYCDLHTFYH